MLNLILPEGHETEQVAEEDCCATHSIELVENVKVKMAESDDKEREKKAVVNKNKADEH
jgi:hypothetical protein